MAEEAKKKGLGRGLEALLGDSNTVIETPTERSTKGVRDVPIEFLKANPNQPRKAFAKEDLEDLAASIKERGVLQPIIVRPVADDGTSYEIVAGERRWRAAQLAQRHTIPVLVRELSDAEVLEVALVENIQRADLNSMEEAAGYQALIQQFKYTQDQLSKVIGKSRSHVANTLRLLSLPSPVQELVRDGKLSAGHARTIIGSDKPADLAKEIIDKNLNVRQAEALVRRSETPSAPRVTGPRTGAARQTPPERKDADTLALERNVSNALGLNVSIDYLGDKGGEVKISYTTLEQLDEVCRRLAQTSSL